MNRKQALLALIYEKPLGPPPSEWNLEDGEVVVWNALDINLPHLRSRNRMYVQLMSFEMARLKRFHDWLIKQFNEAEAVKAGTGPSGYLAKETDPDADEIYHPRHVLFDMYMELEVFVENVFDDLCATKEQRKAIYKAVGITKSTAEMEAELHDFLQ